MQRYHITDLSKVAMLVERASVVRTQRYDRWYGLLVEELDFIATSGSGIVAVGNAVAQHLKRCAFPRPFTKVIHYSSLASRARTARIFGYEASTVFQNIFSNLLFYHISFYLNIHLINFPDITYFVLDERLLSSLSIFC